MKGRYRRWRRERQLVKASRHSSFIMVVYPYSVMSGTQIDSGKIWATGEAGGIVTGFRFFLGPLHQGHLFMDENRNPILRKEVEGETSGDLG